MQANATCVLALLPLLLAGCAEGVTDEDQPLAGIVFDDPDIDPTAYEAPLTAVHADFRGDIASLTDFDVPEAYVYGETGANWTYVSIDYEGPNWAAMVLFSFLSLWLLKQPMEMRSSAM